MISSIGKDKRGNQPDESSANLTSLEAVQDHAKVVLPKITLIECWFGPFPTWFDYYLKSCESNGDVSWIIFSDTPAPARRPANVAFLPLSKSELEAKATALLGIPVKLSTGFKVCDLRPAFGVIFSDYLKDSDFWGYNDSDLFWGRVRHFLPPDILNNYDVITACRTSICGQLTLFRNRGVTRDIYQIIPKYEECLTTPEPRYMDEVALDQAMLSQPIRVYRRQLQVHDIGSSEWEEKARRMEMEEKGNLDEWFWEGGACRWHEGKLIHIGSNKEAMFFHFKSWKQNWKREFRVPRLEYWDQSMAGFTVDERGLHPEFKSRQGFYHSIYFLRYFFPLRIRACCERAKSGLARVYHGVKRRVSTH